jgi:hypothetical protein
MPSVTMLDGRSWRPYSRLPLIAYDILPLLSDSWKVETAPAAPFSDLHAGLQLALRGLHLALQHDVDAAGDGLGAVLGGGGAHDLDALDHLRRHLVQREARRRRFAVQQDLRIAAAQAAHADVAAAALHAAHGDAGQALEHFAQRGVAVAQDLFLVDDDLGGGVVAARVVGGGLALDFDFLQLGDLSAGLSAPVWPAA